MGPARQRNSQCFKSMTPYQNWGIKQNKSFQAAEKLVKGWNKRNFSDRV